MSNSDRPGELGPLFDDSREQLPEHLSWEAVSEGIPARNPAGAPSPDLPATVSSIFLKWWPWCCAAVVGTLGLILFTTAIPSAVPTSDDVPESLSKMAAAKKATTTQGTVAGQGGPSSSIAPPAVAFSANTISPDSRSTTGESAIPGGRGHVLSREQSNERAHADGSSIPKADGHLAPRQLEALTTLPGRPITSVSRGNCTEARNKTLAVVSLTSTPDIPQKKFSAVLDFAVGGNRSGDLPDELSPASGLALSAAYRINRPSGWSFSAGLRYDESVWRSSLTRTDPVMLYRPGTVDTVFVDLTTGEERYATRDSVPGTRLTRFTGEGRLRTLGLDLRAGKNWLALGGRVSLFTVAKVDYLLGADGSTVSTEREVTEAPALARPAGSVLFVLGGAVRYERPLFGRIGAFTEAGYEFQLSEPLSGYAQPTFSNRHLALGMVIKIQ